MNIYQVTTEAATAASKINSSFHLDKLVDKLLNLGYELGIKLITCIIVYYIGRLIIRWIQKIINNILEKKKIEQSVKSFLSSLVNVTLTIMLAMSIIGILGIQTTSFAAVIASAGLAIGMAMKDNLGNFAGGVMILFNKPIKIGDYISAQSQEGTVKSIGILYTILTTVDNKTIYIPNGPLSTGNILNYSSQEERRVDITFGVEYGTSVPKVKKVLNEIFNSNPKILKTPKPFIALTKLNDHSVDFIIRIWVKSTDYWSVYYYINESVYERFIQEDITIPFQQVTVHLAKEN